MLKFSNVPEKSKVLKAKDRIFTSGKIKPSSKWKRAGEMWKVTQLYCFCKDHPLAILN